MSPAAPLGRPPPGYPTIKRCPAPTTTPNCRGNASASALPIRQPPASRRSRCPRGRRLLYDATIIDNPSKLILQDRPVHSLSGRDIGLVWTGFDDLSVREARARVEQVDPDLRAQLVIDRRQLTMRRHPRGLGLTRTTPGPRRAIDLAAVDRPGGSREAGSGRWPAHPLTISGPRECSEPGVGTNSKRTVAPWRSDSLALPDARTRSSRVLVATTGASPRKLRRIHGRRQ
jgi:hypothetical protein